MTNRFNDDASVDSLVDVVNPTADREMAVSDDLLQLLVHCD
jgi:hypothetical protein